MLCFYLASCADTESDLILHVIGIYAPPPLDEAFPVMQRTGLINTPAGRPQVSSWAGVPCRGGVIQAKLPGRDPSAHYCALRAKARMAAPVVGRRAHSRPTQGAKGRIRHKISPQKYSFRLAIWLGRSI
ncbi:leucine-rich repeat protein [Perkinsela sp. CCAP 1560/4]|nr:leucine-rich repeat protein [Perkinsela sp. CCAP 1560/4]|eukprot:KNH04153.1 leucine-rich repeat protein [Perkinsela sp. CCAP 1560/4]